MRSVTTALVLALSLAAAMGCSKQPATGPAGQPGPAVSEGDALPPGVKRVSEEEAFAKVKELGGEVIERTPQGKPLKDYVRFIKGKVHGKDLTFLHSIPYLHELSFQQSDIQDEDLAQLRGLKELSALGITYTQVTDACLPHLESMPKLAWLTFDGTKVSREGAKAFRDKIAPRQKWRK